MSNLVLTDSCNLNCSYCFNQKTQEDVTHGSGRFMSLKVFKELLQYLRDSGIDQVRLLGGEPTLHPLFMDFVEYSLKMKFSVLLFSNGLMPNGTKEKLRTLSSKEISILLNIADPEINKKSVIERQTKTMELLGDKIFLGITVYHLNHDYGYLLRLIDMYSLQRKVRVGLAHPNLTGSNEFLNPKYYPLVGEQLEIFWNSAKRDNIRLEFDCGFVPCMFSERFLQEEMPIKEAVFFHCSPIIDISSDGSAISCFPLFSFEKVDGVAHRSSNEILDHFFQRLSPYRDFGIYPYCSRCELFSSRICAGGCRAAAMLRLKNFELSSPFQH